MELTTTVNDEARVVEVDGTESVVDVVRDGLGLTGTKLVCGSGVCGACTVLVDGEPVLGCLTPATRLRDADVTTVEGLADGDDLHPVQRAFAHHDGLQCGYCTPGFVVSAVAFHDRWRAEHGADESDGPDRETIAEALAGHLCRCGSYEGIYRAVAAACRGEHDEGATRELERVERVERVEAPAKLTGAAVYTTDVVLPGMLHAAIRRSDLAAGVVGPITFPEGVLGIDVLGDDRRVRWAGQPIAVVAAESAAAARRAARELTVPFTALPVRPRPRRGRPPGRAARLRDAGGPQGGAERRARVPRCRRRGTATSTARRARRSSAPSPSGASGRPAPRAVEGSSTSSSTRPRSCTPPSSRMPASPTGATRSTSGCGSAPRASGRCASRSPTTSTSTRPASRSSPSTSAAASAPSSA